MNKYIMALDQGTTTSRCILFDKNSTIVSIAQKELKQIYPKSGWVEHDPMEILGSQLGVIQEAMAKIHVKTSNIAAIGISNQRETTLIWNKKTGIPIYNAIVWQCRRTSDICDELKANGYDSIIKEKTGLIVDAYFSATKIKWILDNVSGAKLEAEKGNLIFGTIDTWLIWNLTRGKSHMTDYSNASRTMMYNINNLEWDKEILKMLNLSENILPEVKPSSYIYGYVDSSFFGSEIPIAGVAGDQQSSLFGQTCFEIGNVKTTYGTGGFMLMNTGKKIFKSNNGLLTSIAWGIDGNIDYVLEGSIFIAGASVQWLRDELKLIDNVDFSEVYAESVPDSNGVYVVPAFVGLGAPYWDPYARGVIIGITRGTKKEHIIRATLESIALQTYDVLKAMQEDAGMNITEFKVDGGASNNNFIMQFQSNILDIPVCRPEIIETTALGAAYLAGIAVNYWANREEIIKNYSISKKFMPNMDERERDKIVKGWHKAIKRSMNWA